MHALCLCFVLPEIHAMLRQVFHLLLIACVVLISGSRMVVCKVTFLSCTTSVFFVVEHFDWARRCELGPLDYKLLVRLLATRFVCVALQHLFLCLGSLDRCL